MTMPELVSKTAEQQSFVNQKPNYKLYTVKGVAIATLFGTPLAGGYLMARNYKLLGNKSYAKRAVFYSVLTIIASLLIGMLLPEQTPSVVVSVPVLIAMVQAMKYLQGPSLTVHQQNGGEFASCWKAFGISLLFMVAILALFVVGVMILDPEI